MDKVWESQEFQINQGSLESQNHATVAMDQEGVLFVSWTRNADGLRGAVDKEVVARFLREGKADDEFPAGLIPGDRETAPGIQQAPDVSTNRNGLFVIAWPSETAGGEKKYGIRVGVYGCGSQNQNFEIDVTEQDSLLSDSISWPDVAMVPGSKGDFIVIWDVARKALDREYKNFWVRLFDGRQNEAIRINEQESFAPSPEGGTRHYGLPDIAVSEIAGIRWAFAVWERWEDTGNETRPCIAARKINLGDRPLRLEPEFLIASPGPRCAQRRPMTDMNANGDLLVTWTGIEGDTRTVLARKYTAATASWGKVLAMPGNNEFDQHRSVCRLMDSGGFFVAWTRTTQDRHQGDVYLQCHDPEGQPTLLERVTDNQTETRHFNQRRPALDFIEEDGALSLIIIWESAEQDGDSWGIFGKRYRFTF